MGLKIGILGGTFNPIHTGHLMMAEAVLSKLKLNYVLFIPCALSPTKSSEKLAESSHRLKMVERAVKGNPSFKVSKIELERGGRSYSVDTLDTLKKIYKNKTKFFFIIGADNLSQLCKWKQPDRLFKLCTPVVVGRQGIPLISLGKYYQKQAGLTKAQINKLRLINAPTLPISSTGIRAMVRKGRPIRYLVPEPVRRYILRYKLYNSAYLCG